MAFWRRVSSNQLVIDGDPSDNDVVQTKNGDSHNQNDDNKKSLSDCISQFFRSTWERLSCCKKPTGENPSPESEDQQQVPERCYLDKPAAIHLVDHPPKKRKLVEAVRRNDGTKTIAGKNHTNTM